MGYVFAAFQLMAWHSGAGFTLFVTDNKPTLAILLNESYDQWAIYLTLAAEVQQREACLIVSDETNPFWVCKAHRHSRSILGHVSEIDKIEAKQRRVTRKINRLTRRIIQLIKQQP